MTPQPTVAILHCVACQHEWIPRQVKLPAQCPRCGNRHWQAPKPKKVKK